MTRLIGHAPLDAELTTQYEQTARSNETMNPLPAPTKPSPYRATPEDVGIKDDAQSMSFITFGDSGGVVSGTPQKNVAAAMVAAVKAAHVDFVYHLGDWVYYNGDASQWFQQFYEPYDHIAAPIVGVPGNHDGDNSDDRSVPSLDAWRRNVMAPSPVLTPEAGDSNRDAMTQPNCYWTLELKLATIIGLYTNVPSGGVVDATQAAWLAGELKAADPKKPVIVALHHPPYSADSHHGGSMSMGRLIDVAAANANRLPTLVLSGHVHDYQRFQRSNGVTYVVAGAGGYHNLHYVSTAVKALPWQATPDTKLMAYDDKNWGFLRITLKPGAIWGAYHSVSKTGVAKVGDKFKLKG